MEWGVYIRALLALVFVVGLIGLASLAFKRFMLGKLTLPTQGKKRLAVTEMLALDTKRRLVLIRRDNVEHLLLLGVTSETVVESNIPRQEPAGGERS